MAPSVGGRAPQVYAGLAHDHHDLLVGPSGRKCAFSVKSPRRENTAGVADAPLDARERLTQNQPAKVPTTTTPEDHPRAGLGEKLMSARMRSA
jgi:hypothetical protein